MSPAKYGSIPDSEQPDDIVLPSSDALIAKAQEKYPEAGTKIEAEFLGRLDDAIDNCQPKIEIPRISPDQLKPSSEIDDKAALFDAVKLPTAALVAMIAAALALLIVNSPLAKLLYPYFACVTTFMASVPDIRKRFMSAVVPVFDKFDSMKGQIEGRVEGVSTKGFKYLGVTEKSMNQAIAPIKDKVAFATKMETALKQVDPNIDIPDTSDIEDKFNGFEDELTKGFDGMQDAVDFSRSLPAPLQSLEKYQIYVMMPFLVIMLGLQLYGVYSTTNKDEAGEVVAYAGRMLQETNSTLAPTTAPTMAPTDETYAEYSEEQFQEIWVAIQCYVSTVAQIVIAFLVTNARAMTMLLNSQIGVMEGRVNKELKKAVGDVFEDIFQKGFGAVKDKFLSLIRKVDKIEGPINEVKSKIPGVGKIPGGGSFLGKFGKK